MPAYVITTCYIARLLIDTYQLSIISADDEGNTLLHLAVMFSQNKCVDMLLNVVNTPVFVRNSSGKSVLDVASEQKTKTIIKLMITSDKRTTKLNFNTTTNSYKICLYQEVLWCTESH